MSHASQRSNVLSTLKHATVRMTAQEIADRVGIIEMHSTCVRTRGMIRELIKDGYPIGSNAMGYRLMTTAKEVQVYLNSLLKRQIALSTRIQNVYEGAKLEGLI